MRPNRFTKMAVYRRKVALVPVEIHQRHFGYLSQRLSVIVLAKMHDVECELCAPSRHRVQLLGILRKGECFVVEACQRQEIRYVAFRLSIVRIDRQCLIDSL